MSILTQNNPDQSEILARRAEQIKFAPRQLAEQMYRGWESSFGALWGAGGQFTPAEKLAAIGTDAAELFALNTAFVTFMITNLTGKRDDIVAEIQAKIASMPAFTVNTDGTVTIDEVQDEEVITEV